MASDRELDSVAVDPFGDDLVDVSTVGEPAGPGRPDPDRAALTRGSCDIRVPVGHPIEIGHGRPNGAPRCSDLDGAFDLGHVSVASRGWFAARCSDRMWDDCGATVEVCLGNTRQGYSRRMRFEVLGPLRVQRDGATIPLTSGRQRALLANLLIADGDTVSADALIEAIWGDDLPSDPANTLQHGIAQLRKLLEPGRTRSEPPQILVSEGNGYRLDLNGHSIDSHEFATAIEKARNHPEGSDEMLTEALGLWRGSAYADFAYSEFARAESERLDELRIQARELLIDAVVETSGPGAVIPDLEGLVVEYPHREGLWSRLMRALYQTGRQVEALRVYQDAERILGEGLGIAPSAELTELEEQILLQDPSLAAPRLNGPVNNLPTPPTELIGRQDALRQLLSYLDSSRLTTLLGPGGSGKTRLAIEAAHMCLDEYQDGVWLVRLDDLADPYLLEATVGAVVGMPENRESEVVDTLVGFLAEKRTLLVLDNCEHLVESVAALAETLLASCPSLVLLATSQQALSVTGEQRMPIPPLDLPADSSTPFADLENVPAVELFLARAAAINPEIDASSASIAAIANIVGALDGIPLAIELAAARTDVLTPTEIARRLTERFELFDTAPRDAPARQRTLRSAVEWSTAMLDADTIGFFLRLSVFSGGFDIEAAAAITETDESIALSVVGALVQRSLVNRVAAVGGVARFRLLETLRIFGTERLTAEGEHDTVRNLHLDHYAERITRYDDELQGPKQTAAFEGVVADQDNLRAAMGWSLESGRFAGGVHIVAQAGRFWDWRGSLAEGGTWTNRFLEAVEDESTPDLSFLVSWAGYVEWELGREERARELIATSLRIATENNDAYGRAAALTGVALQARVGGDAAKAVEANAEVRRLAIEKGDEWLAAWADNHDGLSLLAAGDIEAAEAAGQASLDEYRRIGDRRATGWALTVLAQIALARQEHERVLELANEAAKLSCQAGDGRNAAWAMELAAESARASGDEAAATRHEADAAQLLRERGVPQSPYRRSE